MCERKGYYMRNITAMEAVSEMKIGWNLGNSFDAPRGETTWNNPKTTKKMIDDIAAAGFKTMRLPVSWHVFAKGENFEIDSDYINRVEEVANYALDNGMYVIINSHHDNHMYYPSFEHEKQSKHFIECIWRQIAEHFKNYDEHLIFESLNEPRMSGTTFEWTGGSDEGREVINRINKVFYDTVRATGGNNKDRILYIPSHAAALGGLLKDFRLPANDGKIILSVHCYNPNPFALNKIPQRVTDKWDASNPDDTREIDAHIIKPTEKWTSLGVPVVMGEFGASHRNNTPERAEWARYVVKTAKAHGMVCIWWDNNYFIDIGDGFGLYDRNKCEWAFPEIVDAMMDEVYKEE